MKLKTFFVILKSGLIVACFGIFFSQALTFFNIYQSQATVSGSQFVENGVERYPSLSFCPYKIHKSKDYPLSMEQFLNFSYKWVRKYNLIDANNP